jgi:hypothetical protein
MQEKWRTAQALKITRIRLGRYKKVQEDGDLKG